MVIPCYSQLSSTCRICVCERERERERERETLLIIYNVCKQDYV